MKNKNLIIAIVVVFLAVAASVVLFLGKGDYKEGTYYGTSGTHIAVVYVNEKGLIKSVFIDSAYIEYANGACKNTEVAYGTTKCIGTTKQILGDNYAMRSASEIEKEWFEQANAFADKVVEEQGLSWLTVKADGYTDSISSVTMHVTDLQKAVEQALNKAKK